MKKTLGLGWVLGFMVASLPAAAWMPPPLFDNPQAYPLFAGSIPFLSQETAPIPIGSFDLRLQQHWWNAFRFDFATESTNTTFVDSEGILSAFSLGWGIDGSWSMRLRAEFSTNFPGIMDGPLHRFHTFFGFPNQGREFFPANRVRILHRQGKVLVMDVNRVSPALSLLHASVWRPLFQEGPHSLTLSLGFKAPLPWAMLLGSQWGLQGGLAWNQSHKPWHLFWGASVGAAWMEADFLPSGQESNLLWQAGLHVGWSWTENWTVLVQLDTQGSPYAGAPSIASGRQGNLLLGTLWEVQPGFILAFGIMEEGLTWATNEVGFFFQIVYRPQATP